MMELPKRHATSAASLSGGQIAAESKLAAVPQLPGPMLPSYTTHEGNAPQSDTAASSLDSVLGALAPLGVRHRILARCTWKVPRRRSPVSTFQNGPRPLGLRRSLVITAKRKAC